MIFTIVVFFIVLGVLVIVHELGHFFAATKAGVKVDEFGFGLPPRIFGFYKDENKKWKVVGAKSQPTTKTIWSLNWIPLGGFVKIKGEEGDNPNDPDSFVKKSVARRIWIVSAGVLMNVLLAMVLLTIALGFGSPQVIDSTKELPKFAKVNDIKIRVFEVLPDSPAKNAGLEVGDVILGIDGQVFTKVESFQVYLADKVDQAVKVKVERKKSILEKEIVPKVIAETNQGGLGVGLVNTGTVSYPWYIAPWYGITETLKMVWGVLYGFYTIIKSLIVSRQMIGDVYGPVGIATLVGDAARLGFLYLVQFTATLSVIIAVINFLPFPALDGGRVFFLLIEGLRGKPINQRFETAMHNLGFALLMILIVIVTFRDIARISSGFLGWWRSISGLF